VDMCCFFSKVRKRTRRSDATPVGVQALTGCKVV
jgi:hypothetical protein